MPRYLCSKCDMVIFGSARMLIWHLKNRHAVLAGGMFICPITCGQAGCLRTYRYPYALKRHIENEHNEIPCDNENSGGDDSDDEPMQDLSPEF